MATNTAPAMLAKLEALADIEATCRDFAREFPTPNVQAAIAYAESGRLTWVQISGLFARSLAAGMAA